jgi:hypothetical protein
MSAMPPGRVKTLRGITAPGILRLVVTLRAKKCKKSSSAQRYNQIRFRFHTAYPVSDSRPEKGGLSWCAISDIALYCSITSSASTSK